MADASVRTNQQAMHFGTHMHSKGFTADDLEGMSSTELSVHSGMAGMGRAPRKDMLSLAGDYMRKLSQPSDDPFAGL